MKTIMKRIMASLLAIMLVGSSVIFAPKTTSADPLQWYEAYVDQDQARTDVYEEGDEQGLWRYTIPKNYNSQGQEESWMNKPGSYRYANSVTDFLFKTAEYKYNGFYLKLDDAKQALGLQGGRVYKLTIKLKFTYSNSSHTNPVDISFGTQGAFQEDNISYTTQNTTNGQPVEFSGTIVPDKDSKLKFSIGVGNYINPYTHQGVGSGLQPGTFSIESLDVQDQGWEPVPNDQNTPVGNYIAYANFNETHAQYGQWGQLSYKENPDSQNEMDTHSFLCRCTSQWLDGDTPAVQCYANFIKYEKYTIEKLFRGEKYTGVLKVRSSKPTAIIEPDGKEPYQGRFRFNLDGKDYDYHLNTGEQNVTVEDIPGSDDKLYTLTIPEFTFSGDYQEGGSPDILFRFDELQKMTEITIEDLQFTCTTNDGWTNLPINREDESTTVGPWTCKALYNLYPPNPDRWGRIAYKSDKQNPTEYNDMTFKLKGVSGYRDAWATQAIWYNFNAIHGCEEEESYTIKMTVYSDTATGIDTDPKYAGQRKVLRVKCGDLGTLDAPLEVGDNYLEYNFVYRTNSEKNKDLELWFDNLELFTEIKIKSIELVHNNQGFTNVPDDTPTAVGPWTLYAKYGGTDYGKLAYKTEGSPDDMGNTTVLVKRRGGDVEARDTMMTLTHYTTDKGLVAHQQYMMAVNITYDESLMTEFGTRVLRASLNGADNFDFKLKPGTYTYIIPRFTYTGANTNVRFDLDELGERSMIKINSVEFGEAIDLPKNGTGVTATDLGNGTIRVEVEPKDTIYPYCYGAGEQHAGPYKYAQEYVYYVDGAENVVTDDTDVNISGLTAGRHEIEVRARANGIETTTGLRTSVVVTADVTTTARPTETYPTTSYNPESTSHNPESTTDPSGTTVNPESTTVNPASTTTTKTKKPAKVKIKKIYKKKRSAKKLKIKIKKAARAKGYQFKVFKSKKNAKKRKKAIYTKTFKKYKKKFTLKSKKLKKKKKLYVRVRAFNYVNGKNGKKQYGAWSKIKKVKIKR